MVHEKVALNGHNPVSVLPFPNRHQGTKKKPAALERMERHGKHSKEDELEDISNPGLLKLAQT